ncbi:MAG TPA: 2'-5' RNA ligase family protein [Candidatus Dormibacteraeota bacterium]|nr:2'-5' RNA ligase family protein [Candidatus Dormibacteraeota bacterium]
MESAVLVPALGVGRLVHDLRMRYDPSAAAGIPPHVTLMFPFVPPADLTEPTIDILEKVISGASAFQFSFVRVNQFEQGVVYLEPEPVEPFAKLTREIGRQFGILPYGGEFGEDPVIHLTVAAGASASERQQVANQLAGLGRSVLRADEAWLIVGTNAGGWSVVRKLRFLA